MKKYLLLIASFILTLQIKAQTVSDADGNTYNTVTIGTQTWMKENLKTTKYNDGIAIPLVTDYSQWKVLSTPAYSWNNFDITNKVTYGALYNWYTVNTGKLCPTGWHVPSDAEWTTLVDYLIANGYNYDGTTTGNKVAKALASTTNWSSSTDAGSIGNTDYPAKRNATGFSAVPGGANAENGIDDVGSHSYFWSSTEYDSNYAYFRALGYNHNSITRIFSNESKVSGFSVRCLKDGPNAINTLNDSADNFIYPNPVTDKLYIRNDKLSNAQIMIFDLQGKQFINRQIGSNPIDISGLSKGVYIVKIIDSGKTMISKLIKE